MDELGGLLAARRHAEESAHAHLAALRAVVDLEAEPLLTRDLRGHAGQMGRVHVVGGAVDEIARERGGLAEDLAGADTLRHLARAPRVGREHGERLHDLFGLLLLVAIECVRPEDRPLHDGVSTLACGHAVTENLERDGARPEITRAPQARGCRPPQHFGRRVLARPEPHDDDAA